MMTVKWQDKKLVSILTAMHDNFRMMYTGKKSRKMGEPVLLPKPVLDCNKGMGCGGGVVDTMDQQRISYCVVCRYLKAYKIF
jgi:hypothetical protein